MKATSILKLGLVCTCLAVLYFSVFKSLVYDWLRIPEYSHGFLVPVVSCYMAWNRRNVLQSIRVLPSNWGLVIILIGIFLFFLGKFATAQVITRISFIVVSSGLVLFFLGWSHFKHLLPPILFLLFMIPVPGILEQSVTVPLQLVASHFSEILLKVIRIPVFREGNILSFPDFTLQVAESCSGIRSLISILALGTIFSFFCKNRLWEKFLLIFLCFPVAILVNSLRIAMTAMLTLKYGIMASQGFYHTLLGYFIFPLAILLLFGVYAVLSRIPG